MINLLGVFMFENTFENYNFNHLSIYGGKQFCYVGR